MGLPARVESIEDNIAMVDVTGAHRRVAVELIDGVKPGDYVMIHAGIAIARITAEEAEETRAVLEELYDGWDGGGDGKDVTDVGVRNGQGLL